MSLLRGGKLEGSPYSQIVGLMGKAGYNADVEVVIGKVKSPPPNLVIVVDKLELDKDDLIVLEHLTKRTQKDVKLVGLPGNPTASLEFGDDLRAGDSVVMLEIREGQEYVVLDRVVRY